MEPPHSAAAKMDDYHQGNVLRAQGRLDEAIASFRRAVALNPNHVEALNNLGNALKARGQLDEALACLEAALQIKPDYAEAYSNLGNVLQQQEKLDEAVAAYGRAVELKPQIAEVHHNLANALHAQGKLEEAIASFQRALELKPGLLETLNNLGIAYQELRRFDEAIDAYRRALAINPEYARPYMNLSLIALLSADFQRGWPLYEWRWKTGQLAPGNYLGSIWNGEPLNGKTILLHAEQGLGDTMQFIRYAPIVKALGAAVLVECQKPLVNLLASCAGIDRLVPAGGYLPRYDFHIPLLSLPRILKTDLTSVPAQIPYIHADSRLVEQWRHRLRPLGSFQVAINWRGEKVKIDSVRRAIPFDFFASLAHVPGAKFINIHKGKPEDLAVAHALMPLIEPGHDFDTDRGAFMDTAAIMMNVDLVITSDTSTAHLAGALGVPVWVALPFVPDWRWMLDRNDTPWYPTMRLFRQKSFGDWAGVFHEIRAALHKLVATREAP